MKLNRRGFLGVSDQGMPNEIAQAVLVHCVRGRCSMVGSEFVIDGGLSNI